MLPDRSLVIGQKSVENAKIKKNATFRAVFKHCENKINYQTVLPDRSFLIGQKSVENAKIKKCDISSSFQTM